MPEKDRDFAHAERERERDLKKGLPLLSNIFGVL